MGVSISELGLWLNRLSPSEPIDIREVLSDYEETMQEKLSKITLLPFPPLVDVKVRLSSRVLHLMSNSEEDKSFTEHVPPHLAPGSQLLVSIFEKEEFYFQITCSLLFQKKKSPLLYCCD